MPLRYETKKKNSLKEPHVSSNNDVLSLIKPQEQWDVLITKQKT